MSLPIVMYHDVRGLARSCFPRIKGRTLETFLGQLDDIAANYEVVTTAQIIAAKRSGDRLPDNALR